MRKYLLLFILVFLSIACKEESNKKKIIKTKNENIVERNQKNIINWKDFWEVGEGSVENFKSFGKEHESQRVSGLDIDNKPSVLWECIPDTTTVWDGGFMSKIEIDKTSSYLFVVWVKQTINNTANIYYAFDQVQEVTGEYVKNANFIGAGSKLSELDKWYALVGYIYPNNHQDNIEAEVISGLYLDGVKVQDGRDFKWSNTANTPNYRVVQVNSSNIDERLYIWNPQLYKVDGTEPKLNNLL